MIHWLNFQPWAYFWPKGHQLKGRVRPLGERPCKATISHHNDYSIYFPEDWAIYQSNCTLWRKEYPNHSGDVKHSVWANTDASKLKSSTLDRKGVYRSSVENEVLQICLTGEPMVPYYSPVHEDTVKMDILAASRTLLFCRLSFPNIHHFPSLPPQQSMFAFAFRLVLANSILANRVQAETWNVIMWLDLLLCASTNTLRKLLSVAAATSAWAENWTNTEWTSTQLVLWDQGQPDIRIQSLTQSGPTQ